MPSLPRIAATLAALTLGVGVAACGSDDDASSTASTQASTAATSEAAAGAFPVTIDHKFGSTEIASEPERVVVVGYTELDTVLALGVTPVGTRAFLGGYDWQGRPWAQDIAGTEDIEVVGEEEINYEAVAAQRPDLIIAINTGMTEADYDRLSKIAPTIATSGDYVDFGMPWEEQTEMIGKALGRSEEAEEVVAEVDARFEQVRKDHPEWDGATSVMAYGGPDGYGAYTSEDLRARYMSDLGFVLPEKIDELAGDSFYVGLSQEQFRLLDQDVVIMYGPQDDIESNPVFSKSNAVKEDRVVYLDLGDDAAGAIGYASPLSLPWLLEETVPMIEAAFDGDPKTAVTQPE